MRASKDEISQYAVPTTLSATSSGGAAAGDRISAAATLAGGSSPTGTITFDVYGPGDTSCARSLATSTVTVRGNGTYGSAAFTAPAAGVYRWIARYGGDDANAAAGPTSCAAVGVTDKPDATSGAASAVTETEAKLSGTVNPDGLATNYTFAYGTSPAFGSVSTVASAGSGFADVPATAALTDLAPGTTYYYRLVATNGRGTRVGADRAFRTTGTPIAPIAVTLPALLVGATWGTLAGEVDSSGQGTVFTFEYGTSMALGAISPVVALDADGLEPVSVTLAGLAENTTYYYRLVATNATGTTVGTVQHFYTGPGGPPIVLTGEANPTTGTTAVLSATVDPHGAKTAFAFEYGATTELGQLSALDSAGDSNAAQSVSLPIRDLLPGTTYLYRVVATNANGTMTGGVRGFTTPEA